jgi:transcriptional regulator with XRE-family HTH domain
MTAAIPTEERLKRVDRELIELQHGAIEAARRLQEAPEIDGSFEERWRRIAERLRDVRRELQPQDFDKEQLVQVYGSLLDIRDTMDRAESSRDMEAFDQLLVQLERIRHVVRDALDEHVTGASGDVGLVMKDLDAWLPRTSREALAELAGVDRRTLSRWAGKAGSPSRRLRTLARLVAILRHAWTEEGVVAWFHRPRRDLQGRTPLALLNDPNFDEDALLAAARAGRSQYAS